MASLTNQEKWAWRSLMQKHEMQPCTIRVTNCFFERLKKYDDLMYMIALLLYFLEDWKIKNCKAVYTIKADDV